MVSCTADFQGGTQMQNKPRGLFSQQVSLLIAEETGGMTQWVPYPLLWRLGLHSLPSLRVAMACALPASPGAEMAGILPCRQHAPLPYTLVPIPAANPCISLSEDLFWGLSRLCLLAGQARSARKLNVPAKSCPPSIGV